MTQSSTKSKRPAPIYITNLDRCLPRTSLSTRPKRGRWRVLDYETESLKGAMLVAGQTTAAPQITCPVRKRGWYAIHFAIGNYLGNSTLLVRLKSSSTFSRIIRKRVPPRSGDELRPQFYEHFWKCAELTNEDIILKQFTMPLLLADAESTATVSEEIWLAYIKLVPLSAAQVKAFQADRKSKKHRKLFGHNDAYSYTGMFGACTREEIRREIEPLIDSDFSRLYWEGAAGDITYYPSKNGLSPARHTIDDHFAVNCRASAHAWQIMQRKKIDPFRVALEYAQANGLEFHATYRPGGFQFQPPLDEWNKNGLFEKHPEWHGRDRDGRHASRLSYSYPGVRQQVISFIREMTKYPVDGVCIAYNRRLPLVDYEDPLVEGFKARYQKDSRQLPERDPRWLAFRSTFMTQFMRELRRAMDEVYRQQKRTKPIEISAIVMATERENIFYALDLKSWVREKLVDTLIPYSSHENESCSTNDSWTNPRDAHFFLQLTRGTQCKLALNLLPRQISPEQYRIRTQRLYRAGVQHLFVWDVNQRHDYGASWTTLRRLGHRSEIEAWVRAGQPRLAPAVAIMQRIGDWNYGYQCPG